MTTIDTYEVTCTYPRLSEPLVMEMVATSPARALSRARGTAFHMYQEAELLDPAHYEITNVKAGIWPDGRD